MATYLIAEIPFPLTVHRVRNSQIGVDGAGRVEAVETFNVVFALEVRVTVSVLAISREEYVGEPFRVAGQGLLEAYALRSRNRGVHFFCILHVVAEGEETAVVVEVCVLP